MIKMLEVSKDTTMTESIGEWENENEATVACVGQGSCGAVLKLC